MSAQDIGSVSMKAHVVFEIDIGEVELSEIQSLSIGSIIPTGRASDTLLEITVNGMTIGDGELVKVNDKVAVRVTRLTNNA